MQEMVRRPGAQDAAASAMDANQAAIALATAMNEARAESADRDAAAQDRRAEAVAGLEALRRKLAPLYAAIPRDVDIFDLGLVAPERPRLFVDIISYVEPGRDGVGWRFMQESRTGRQLLLETEDEPALIQEITRYVARRLVARERALSLEAGERPTPIVRQPAPVLPMTAEEAFRQWTRSGRVEEQERAVPDVPPTAAPTEAAPVPEAAAAASLPVATSAPDAPAPPEDKPWRKPASAEGAVRRETAPPAAVRHSARWWLWPALALLIGLGLGALALYLYATSMAR